MKFCPQCDDVESADMLGCRPNFQYARFQLGYGFHLKGMYREAVAEYRTGPELGYDTSFNGLGLGNTEQAFSWLEKGFQDHSGELPRIRLEAPFASLRSDPRYADLLKRMGQ
jgi:hypothetical protein